MYYFCDLKHDFNYIYTYFKIYDLYFSCVRDIHIKHCIMKRFYHLMNGRSCISLFYLYIVTGF